MLYFSIDVSNLHNVVNSVLFSIYMLFSIPWIISHFYFFKCLIFYFREGLGVFLFFTQEFFFVDRCSRYIWLIRDVYFWWRIHQLTSIRHSCRKDAGGLNVDWLAHIDLQPSRNPAVSLKDSHRTYKLLCLRFQNRCWWWT